MLNKLVVIDFVYDKKGKLHHMVPGIIVKESKENQCVVAVLLTYITCEEIYINTKKIVRYL